MKTSDLPSAFTELNAGQHYEASAALTPVREMWRRVRQNIDVYYADLLKLDDRALLARWRELVAADWREPTRGWYRVLYREFMAGKHVFEFGSGLGADGIHFMQEGANWTFSDINVESLEVISRICRMHKLTGNYIFIDDNFANLRAIKQNFDAVWANWSLTQLPFDLAREECQTILPRLRVHGRWIEVCYPPQRLKDKPPLTLDWTAATPEQKRTWEEIYDMEKLKSRFSPAILDTILDFNFLDDNVRWVDLRLINHQNL